MSTFRSRAGADLTRCPDCSSPREHADAACDRCGHDPDRYRGIADTTWDDGSPAVQLYEVREAVDNPAPPADLLTVERPAASRWWGWLLSLAVMLSWLLRGCR